MAEATETALACIREEVERAFSSAPGAVLEAALSRIEPADECARNRQGYRRIMCDRKCNTGCASHDNTCWYDKCCNCKCQNDIPQ